MVKKRGFHRCLYIPELDLLTPHVPGAGPNDATCLSYAYNRTLGTNHDERPGDVPGNFLFGRW